MKRHMLALVVAAGFAFAGHAAPALAQFNCQLLNGGCVYACSKLSEACMWQASGCNCVTAPPGLCTSNEGTSAAAAEPQHIVSFDTGPVAASSTTRQQLVDRLLVQASSSFAVAPVSARSIARVSVEPPAVAASAVRPLRLGQRRAALR